MRQGLGLLESDCPNSKGKRSGHRGVEVSEDSVEPAGEEDVGLFGVAGGASPCTGLGGALRSAIDVGWSRKKMFVDSHLLACLGPDEVIRRRAKPLKCIQEQSVFRRSPCAGSGGSCLRCPVPACFGSMLVPDVLSQ